MCDAFLKEYKFIQIKIESMYGFERKIKSARKRTPHYLIILPLTRPFKRFIKTNPSIRFLVI